MYDKCSKNRQFESVEVILNSLLNLSLLKLKIIQIITDSSVYL